MIADIHAAGYEATIHALGERAVDQVLNAVEFTLNGGPNTPRHRIEHIAGVRRDSLARNAQVDPVALFIGAYPACLPFVDTPQAAFQSCARRWPDIMDGDPDGVSHGTATGRSPCSHRRLCTCIAWSPS